MKVPIRYKSSDRYNAGVDVVYDDESKMQYAPFVYATTASGDSGGDGGEEGEDVMVVRLSEAGVADKTVAEIRSAMEQGKSCIIVPPTVENLTQHWYVYSVNAFHTVTYTHFDETSGSIDFGNLYANSESDYPHLDNKG